VDTWVREGLVEYLGEARDVRHAIEAAHCIVLPSFYREGMPRVLLEAAAMGRPVITTDNVGCRDVVKHGETGFLCAPRSAASLASAMQAFVCLTDEQRSAMGRAGRALVEERFEERHVVARYMETLKEILNDRPDTSSAGRGLMLL
jgi:glycosyltransferase involved in cell wall biosynthesis